VLLAGGSARGMRELERLAIQLAHEMVVQMGVGSSSPVGPA
jgi:hypothetical protein